MSLRSRLLVVVLAVVVAGLIGSDLATFSALQSFLVRRVDQQLQGVRMPIERALAATGGDPGILNRPGPGRLISGGAYIELVDLHGKVLARSNRLETSLAGPKLPATLPAPATGGAEVGARNFSIGSSPAGGPRYRVSVSSAPGGPALLVVAIPLKDVADTLHRLIAIEVVVTALAVAACLALGLWLVGLGLRPLNDIEDTAKAISDGDLTRRVPLRGSSRTEVASLGLAFNSMLTQIEAAFAERQASEERLRRFVADASHELRTPLTSIRGYAELFRRGANHRPEDLAKVLSRIEEESAHMGVLVDDLLLLARLDQGRPLVRLPVRLSAVAAAAVEAARAVDPGRDWQLDAPRPVDVMGDKDALRQVIDNLLTNVRTHTPPGTSVLVRVTAEGPDAVLEVADRGPGMEPDVAAHAFERFYRASSSRARDRGGVGLGLSIVAAIAAGHGGRATLATGPGEGTTIRIELPLAPAAGGPALPTRTAASPGEAAGAPTLDAQHAYGTDRVDEAAGVDSVAASTAGGNPSPHRHPVSVPPPIGPR
jgi:two-component system OmpR family sensor kinase